MSPSYEIRMGRQGRLVIPAALRELLGAEEGGVYTAHVDETGALVLRTRDQALAELQRTWSGTGKPSATDELIAERRRQAAAE